jgi:hypothetical protein
MHTLHTYIHTYVMKAHKNQHTYIRTRMHIQKYMCHLPTPPPPNTYTHKYTLAYFPVSIITRMVTARIVEWISDKLT